MSSQSNYLLFKRKNILFWILLPVLYIFSLFYGLLVRCIKFAYSQGLLTKYKSELKIISVGNITVGGSGKTPIVEWLTELLQRENKKIGIVIRGYKRPNNSYSGLITENSSYSEIGDEAAAFKDKFKNIRISVGQDKVKSVHQLEKTDCDVVIIDDGFQHWRLQRDLDIVAIDVSLPLNEQKLLPLGKLREYLSSLKRADIFCLTKVDISEDICLRDNIDLLNKVNPRALQVNTVYEPLGFYDLKTGSSMSINQEKPIAILCGIANPLYFEKMIGKAGFKVKKKFLYPDHYKYRNKDINFIKKSIIDNGIDTIITTHKDAVRLKSLIHLLGFARIVYLKIGLNIIENEELLHNRLLSLFSR